MEIDQYQQAAYTICVECSLLILKQMLVVVAIAEVLFIR